MVCKNCGTELPEDVSFCIACGTPVGGSSPESGQTFVPNMTPPQMNYPPVAPTKKKSKKKLPSILGIVSGFVSIIAAIQVYVADVGSWESSSSYGGDAYTGIQNAAAQTANNVLEGFRMVQSGLSGFLLAFGIATIAYFWFKLNETKEIGQ